MLHLCGRTFWLETDIFFSRRGVSFPLQMRQGKCNMQTSVCTRKEKVNSKVEWSGVEVGLSFINGKETELKYS